MFEINWVTAGMPIFLTFILRLPSTLMKPASPINPSGFWIFFFLHIHFGQVGTVGTVADPTMRVVGLATVPANQIE
ncbi:MAG: hypothetical protein R2875_18360 [Desulfobacterales bacterium]